MSGDLELPDECWESVLRFLNHHRYMESLSLVSNQLLSVTNRLRFSLTIGDPAPPLLPRLFSRFPALTSLDLTRFRGDLDALLHQISRSALALHSLNLSNHPTIPADGLRALAKKMTTLKSLSCSNMGSLTNADLLLIADCFPFLEELDISFPKDVLDISMFEYDANNFTGPVSKFGVKALSLALPKLRKVNLSGNFFICGSSLFDLCKNCHFLEELVIFECDLISQDCIACAIRERPNLTSLSLNEFGTGIKQGNFARPNVTLDFIGSLLSLKSLTCIEFSCSDISDELLCSLAEEGLPLSKLVLQGCCCYSYAGISCFLSKCQFLRHLDLQNAGFLNDQHVNELSVFLGSLVSINLSGSGMLTNLSFFALTRSCPLLSEIKMEGTSIGKNGVEDSSIDFVVNSQVTSLHLAHNSRLTDESIKVFASICPSVQLLDLNYCRGISKGIVEVLKRCPKVRHLSLANSGVKLFGMNFVVPKLEVLDLSWSAIVDEALYIISMSCCGLLHLDIECCSQITAKGVKQLVQNCRQLREINLNLCHEVAADVVAWMVFSRPSLRKIIAPPQCHLSQSQRELFLRHGCIVC